MQKSIKTILSTLEQKKKDQIQYAFEQGLVNQYVEYEPGRFIGVNIQNLPNLIIEQTAGSYSAGSIVQGQRDVIPLHKI